jgi:enterochelin esterase-like enzyme
VILALAAALGGAGAGAANAALPSTWVPVRTGSQGGVVLEGQIPSAVRNMRPSAVYLPPGYDPSRRYPVVYLLHGLPGSPSSFYAGLHFPDVADSLIGLGLMPPFIGVMPYGGPTVNPEQGEWAGAWETFVVDSVVPWVDAHLSTIPTAKGRALAGLCAGGYGAMDIGLRNPGLFGTLESWEGYFAPVFLDGPFANASPAYLRANNPTLLVQHEAALLQKLDTRFYVSVGGSHANIKRSWTISFAAQLSKLRLPHQLWLLPPSERGHFWRATLPSALIYAGAGFKTRSATHAAARPTATPTRVSRNRRIG